MKKNRETGEKERERSKAAIRGGGGEERKPFEPDRDESGR